MNTTIKPQSQEWESLCRKCGQCCFEKIDFEGHIYYTETPCEYLDPDTKLCQVYPDRINRRPGCVRLDSASIRPDFLPFDCPYLHLIHASLKKQKKRVPTD